MPRVESLPYRTVREDRVRAFWYLGLNGTGHELPERLSGWDPVRPVEATVKAEIDVEGALADVGLDRPDNVVVALVWSSSGTRMRGCAEKTSLRADPQQQSLTLECSIPGEQLAESVDLSVLVVLAEPLIGAPPLTPRRAGARLWSQTRNVALSNQIGRFPMQWVDFGEAGLPADASWYLDWQPRDLHRRVDNGLCLLLNSKNEWLQTALRESETEDDRLSLLTRMIRYDVGRTMLMRALHNDELVEDPESFERGTLGATISYLIAALFHDYDLESLAARARRDPGRFEALLQDRLRFPSG